MGSKNKNSHSFLVQGSILAVASILVRLIGIIYRIPLTNILGESGIGFYSKAFEIYNIGLILSSYSLPLAVSKLVAARIEKKEYRNSYKVFICSMIFAVISGMIMALIIYFGAEFFSVAICKAPNTRIPLKVLAPTIFIFAIMGVLRGYFQGKRTMMPTALSQVFEQIVNAVVSIVCANYLMHEHSASETMEAYGAAGGTLGTTIGALAGLVFLVFIFIIYKPVIKKQNRRDKTRNEESYGTIFKLLILTIIPVILSQTIYQISGVLDMTIFSNIMHGKGLEELAESALWGIYSGEYKVITNLPISIASALAAAMIPSIVAAVVRNSIEETKSKIYATVKFNMVIAIPAAIGMSALAEPIMKLLFKESSPLAGHLLQLGGIAILFFALSTVTNAVLQGINYMSLPLIHSAISLGIHVVLLFILLKYTNLGTYALVIGNITFPLVVCILNWISIKKLLNYKQEVIKTFIIPFLSSLIMGLSALLIYKGIYISIKSNTIATTIAILAAVIIYFIFLILFKGLTEEELLNIPKGKTVIKVLKKFKLL